MLELNHSLDREDQIKADFNDSNSDKESKSGAEKGQEDALQTFVFSATLSKDLQRNLKRRVHPKGVSKNKEPASTLGTDAVVQDD